MSAALDAIRGSVDFFNTLTTPGLTQYSHYYKLFQTCPMLSKQKAQQRFQVDMVNFD